VGRQGHGGTWEIATPRGLDAGHASAPVMQLLSHLHLQFFAAFFACSAQVPRRATAQILGAQFGGPMRTAAKGESIERRVHYMCVLVGKRIICLIK
jgi:hypothetical protein